MTLRAYLFLHAAIAVAGFALAWAWIAALPMAYLDPEYPVWRAKLAMLRRCDLGEVLLVGDSRAAVDVMPSLMPVPVTNLAVGGGMPIESYVAVSRALACPVPPRRVVISLDAAHFTEPDLFWERSVKYGFVSRADLALLRQVAAATGDSSLASAKLPDGMSDWLRAQLYAWRFPPFYFASLLKGGGFLRWWGNQARFAQALAARGQYFFGLDPGSSIVASEGHMRSFSPLPVLDHYFDAMLALLAQRGIPADFIAMPINEATGRAVPAAVRTGFSAYLGRYERRYPGFHVIGLVMPAWPNRYFGDEFAHLNPHGAVLLSQRFGACLEQRLAQATGAGCVPFAPDSGDQSWMAGLRPP